MENEKAINTELMALEERANSICINSDADYASAGSFVKEVKALLNKVEAYWEPLRQTAKKAYDEVLSKRKEMVDPLKDTEKAIKAQMADYTKRKEAERKALEEAQRELARKASEERFNAALEAEGKGDVVGAQAAMVEAEVYNTLSETLTVGKTKTKVEGISTRKTYKITHVDASKVPVAVNGVCIRPVDEKAVLALIKACDGKIKIDGIEFEEDAVISVRA